MKICKHLLVLALSVSMISPVLAETPSMPPGVESRYEEHKGAVLKVYSVKKGEYRFVAYVVKWNDSEVIVSDPLSRSDFKVGDTIRFLAQEVHLEKAVPEVFSLSFTLLNQPASALEDAGARKAGRKIVSKAP